MTEDTTAAHALERSPREGTRNWTGWPVTEPNDFKAFVTSQPVHFQRSPRDRLYRHGSRPRMRRPRHRAAITRRARGARRTGQAMTEDTTAAHALEGPPGVGSCNWTSWLVDLEERTPTRVSNNAPGAQGVRRQDGIAPRNVTSRWGHFNAARERQEPAIPGE